jgi:hypothetical protein
MIPRRQLSEEAIKRIEIERIESRLRSQGLPNGYVAKHIGRLYDLRHVPRPTVPTSQKPR